ncbi:MAG: 3-keto-5-aminohexanoate cleavage protein [Firmicutes bacterium]|nr:3-keto-5-aminohexanoate cleavage protein [Bacillota bacterium]
MEKLIITIAPTGNVPTREINPFLPLTPEEIAEDIYLCHQAGAAVAHIHARDGNGKPTADPEVFTQIARQVQQKCDIIIQFSTGARAGKTAAERGACIALKPEMASLTTGSTNFSNSVNFNPPKLIAELAQKMNQKGVKPEVEVFDLSALEYAQYLVKKKILKEPLQINLVLGVPGSLSGSARNLFFLVESLPQNCTWSVTAIGKAHRQLSVLGLALGGHVRTGLEDLNELDEGKPVSNLGLVQRVAALAQAYGREIATPAEARQIFGLS